MTEKKSKFDPEAERDVATLTSSDLKYILDVNQKAIQIYVEVEKQNEQIINILEEFKLTAERIEEKIDGISSNEKTIEEMLSEDIPESSQKTHEILKEILTEVRLTKTGQEKISESIILLNKKIENEIEKKIDEIEKNLFRLVIILGSAGIGTIFTIIQTFVHK